MAPRSAVARIAAVEFGLTSMPGILLDLSKTGARIYLPANAAVPELVTLRLPDGVTRGACCRWRTDDEAGFEFLPGGSQGRSRLRRRWIPQPDPHRWTRLR